MDHLPAFEPHDPPVEVPYLATSPYDDGGFIGYPERHGWDRGDIIRGDFSGHTASEFAAFLQTWLYFGLLSTVLGIPTSKLMLDFVVTSPTDPEARIITTASLPSYINRWSSASQSLPVETKRAHHAEVDKAMDAIWLIVLTYCDITTQEENPAFPQPLPGPVALSIQVLADTLCRAANLIYRAPLNYSWGESKLLVDRMVEVGWCRHALRTVIGVGQTQILWLASTLPRGRDGGNEGQGYHSGCNPHRCLREKVNETEYKTKHRFEGCACQFVEADHGRVVEILTDGGVPSIVVREREDGVVSLEVVGQAVSGDASRKRDYVAFSHVWTDGLGNPFRNSLPACQLLHLQKIADANSRIRLEAQPPPKPTVGRSCTAAKYTPFWIDTLCVPVSPSLLHFRKLSIKRMYQTYAGASAVVVLDSFLLLTSATVTSFERYIRLKLSRWIRRLWTLQEGISNRHLYFQFAGGSSSITSGELLSSVSSEIETSGRDTYTRYRQDAERLLLPFTPSFTYGLSPSPTSTRLPGPEDRLFQLLPLLLHRSTSRHSDEQTCLATLLGLPAAEILAIPDSNPQERMIQLLRQLHHIPALLVFQPPPKVSIPGWRWAPTSLLASVRGTEMLSIPGEAGNVIEDDSGPGLAVSGLPGLILDPQSGLTIQDDQDFVVRLVGSLDHFYDVRFFPGPAPVAPVAVSDAAGQGQDANPLQYDRMYPALILTIPVSTGQRRLKSIIGGLVFLDPTDPSTDCLRGVFHRMIQLNRIVDARLVLLADSRVPWAWAAKLRDQQRWRLT